MQRGLVATKMTINNNNKASQTRWLALPIDKILYIYRLCPHSQHQNNPFQYNQSKHFHQRN